MVSTEFLIDKQTGKIYAVINATGETIETTNMDDEALKKMLERSRNLFEEKFPHVKTLQNKRGECIYGCV